MKIYILLRQLHLCRHACKSLELSLYEKGVEKLILFNNDYIANTLIGALLDNR